MFINVHGNDASRIASLMTSEYEKSTKSIQDHEEAKPIGGKKCKRNGEYNDHFPLKQQNK